MRLLTILACAMLSSLPGVGSARAEKRVALVIGNGAYKHAPQLRSPKNDADDVSAALRRLGFDTITGIDLDSNGMKDVTIRFVRAVRDAEVAIFYYSGHTMQFASVNYLIPTDAKLTDEADLQRMTRIDDVIVDLQHAKALAVMVLDSCRNNPLADGSKSSLESASIQRGLAQIHIPLGMIVAYTTEVGCRATGGTRRNSPYTAAFLRYIEAPEEIVTVFRKISLDVYEKTNHNQLPELSSLFIGEFFLQGRAVALIPDEALWRRIADSNDRSIMEQFINEHPASPHRKEAEAKLSALEQFQNVEAKPSLGNDDVPNLTALKRLLGLNLTDMSIDLRKRYKIAKWVEGVVVTDVSGSLPTRGKALLPGDVVIEIAREPVMSSDDFWIKIDKLKKVGREAALLLIARAGGDLRFVPLSLTGQP